MSKFNQLETEVQGILKVWNANCKTNGNDIHFDVVTGTREKVIRMSEASTLDGKNINKVAEGKVFISELLITCIQNGITKLIHRIEVPMIKTKGIYPNEVQWKNELYRSFLYDSMGTFLATTNYNFSAQVLAEYDLDLDRLKNTGQFAGVKVIVDKAPEGAWYKVGEEYEVFTQTSSNNWGVYSYRAEHKNGIGSIPLMDAKIVKESTKKEDVTEEVKSEVAKEKPKRTRKTKA